VTGPVNLGNPREFTIEQLARLVLDMVGSKSKLVHRPLPSDDPKQRRPDISVAQETLGWQPTVRLEEGLKRTIAYFDAKLSEGGPKVVPAAPRPPGRAPAAKAGLRSRS